jgi:hypothetical protein
LLCGDLRTPPGPEIAHCNLCFCKVGDR